MFQKKLAEEQNKERRFQVLIYCEYNLHFSVKNFYIF